MTDSVPLGLGFSGCTAGLSVLESDGLPELLSSGVSGVVGFSGQVMTVIPGEGPCYRCIFRDLPAAGEIPTCKEAGVLGAVVGVIGSLEATEAVKLIAGVGEPLVGRMLTVDALTMNIRRVPLPKHVPDCPVCGEQPTITAIDPANYIQPACAI